NRRDAITIVNARLFSGTPRNHMNDLQGTLVRLQLHAEADKVAFDLRVDVAKLIGREERRVMIQAAGGGRRELEQRRRFVQANPLIGELCNLGSDCGRVTSSRYLVPTGILQ